jgi:hypothetical protein
MKLLLEKWNKFVNEVEEKSSSVSYQEMIELIKGEEGSEIKIFIDVPKGSPKGFGATEKRPVPFDYGEFPDYINLADGMGWDLIIAPSESGKEWNKIGDLLPVGKVKYKEGTGKEGNDKIVMASGGKISEEDRETLKVFFANMSDRFEEPRISENLSRDLPPNEMQKILAWAGLSGEGEYIGSGTMGNAYRFGDKILKLTKDISEAYASHMIMGREHPNVATIYKVGKRAISPKAGAEHNYVIVSEFLGPYDQSIILTAREMYKDIKRTSAFSKKWYNWEGIDKLNEEEIKSLALFVSYMPEDYRDQAKTRVDEIALGLTFLKNNGVIFSDTQPSNILVKNGKAAIIDLGRSNVNGHPDLEIIK